MTQRDRGAPVVPDVGSGGATAALARGRKIRQSAARVSSHGAWCVRRVMRTLLILLLAQTSCIAVSARAHVGAVADDLGIGVQVGATLGFGVAGERTGVMVTPGVVTGNAPRLGIADSIEVVRLPERGDAPYAWRAGFGCAIALVGEPTRMGPHAALLWLASDRRRSWSGHEKMGGGGASRSVLGVGLEARVEVSVRELESGRERGLGASAALTAEWIRLSRWRCC